MAFHSGRLHFTSRLKSFTYTSLFYPTSQRYCIRVSNERMSRLLSSSSSSNSDTVKSAGESKKKGKKSAAVAIGTVSSNSTEALEEIRKSRIEKMNIVREKGGNPYAYTYSQTHKLANLAKEVVTQAYLIVECHSPTLPDSVCQSSEWHRRYHSECLSGRQNHGQEKLWQAGLLPAAR